MTRQTPDDDVPGASPTRTVLRAAALVEVASLATLVLNRPTVDSDTLASLVGPVHGMSYLVLVALALAGPRTRPLARWTALVPGIGGGLSWWLSTRPHRRRGDPTVEAPFDLSRVAAPPPLPATPSAGPAVEVTALVKDHGAGRPIGPLSFHVPAGAVTGLVGPNGSGKTTTIRMLLGLIRPTAGHATVLGHPLATPRRYLPRVGALVEGPALYPSMSGRDNLRVHARLAGLADHRVDTVLEYVGLLDRGGDRVGTYSLGMRQRLAVAAALLPEPRLLVLDEPANGLDPQGTRDLRALLRHLAADGVACLVSSHLLAEVEVVSDHIIALERGRVLFEGSRQDLVDRSPPRLVTRVLRDTDTAARLLAAAGWPADREEDRLVIALSGADPEVTAGRINRLLTDAGHTVVELVTRRPTLETAFFDLTGTATAQPPATRVALP